MTTLRSILAISLILICTACSLSKPMPQAMTYVIDPSPPTTTLTRYPQTLRMGHVRVAPAFAGKSLVIRTDAVRYTADFYHTFITEPGDMLGTLMAEWLAQAGPFRTVLQPDSTAPATYVLEAVVTELYGDFRPEQPPIAVMTVQFSLVDLQGLAPQTRLEQTISRRIELPEDTPNALVKAYGQALNEILTELAQQMARQNLALQTLPRNA